MEETVLEKAEKLYHVTLINAQLVSTMITLKLLISERKYKTGSLIIIYTDVLFCRHHFYNNNNNYNNHLIIHYYNNSNDNNYQ